MNTHRVANFIGGSVLLLVLIFFVGYPAFLYLRFEHRYHGTSDMAERLRIEEESEKELENLLGMKGSENKFRPLSYVIEHSKH